MSVVDQLPDSLNLPPHLSAHKYFLVCTLTVAAWDTLVLSPRTWRLMRTPEWPLLKILFHFMRLFMPIEFTIVAVAFFDTNFSVASCHKFFLFEPICTAILLAAASAVHVIRIHAIYEKNRAVLLGMGSLFALQIVATAVACGFYRVVPLKPTQGCIAGPKATAVGVYWIVPTLLYTVSLILAVTRSVQSLQAKPLSPWKLMLRDGLNLYGAVWLVNVINVIYWFVITPTGVDDPVKTIVTSMAAVLTTTMTLRIVLSVRGSLNHGGSFALSNMSTNSGSSRTTHVLSSARTGAVNHSSQVPPTFTLDQMRSKAEADWTDVDGKSSVTENKVLPIESEHEDVQQANLGVKITVDREVEYDAFPRAK